MAFWRKLLLIITLASILPFPTGVADAKQEIPVYVFAGQSNMVGAYARAVELPAHEPALSAPTNRALFWGPTADMPRRWAAIQPPTEIWQSVFRSGFGPEVAAARRLAALHPGKTIGIFKFARNATNLYRQWNPSNRVGYYPYLMGRLRAARKELTKQTGQPTRVAGFFWMQGESDSMSPGPAYAYGANLQKLIAAVRRHTGDARLPFVVGQILDARKAYPAMKYAKVIRQSQYNVAKADPYTFLVATEGLKLDPTSPVHFDTDGTAKLGYRMVQPRFGL
jgi:hypothetical protein